MSNVTKTDAEAFCSGVMDYCSQHGYGPETVELMLKRAAEMVPDLSEELEKAGQGVYNAPFIPSDRAQAQQRREEDTPEEIDRRNRDAAKLREQNRGGLWDSKTGKPYMFPSEMAKQEWQQHQARNIFHRLFPYYDAAGMPTGQRSWEQRGKPGPYALGRQARPERDQHTLPVLRAQLPGEEMQDESKIEPRYRPPKKPTRAEWNRMTGLQRLAHQQLSDMRDRPEWYKAQRHREPPASPTVSRMLKGRGSSFYPFRSSVLRRNPELDTDTSAWDTAQGVRFRDWQWDPENSQWNKVTPFGELRQNISSWGPLNNPLVRGGMQTFGDVAGNTFSGLQGALTVPLGAIGGVGAEALAAGGRGVDYLRGLKEPSGVTSGAGAAAKSLWGATGAARDDVARMFPWLGHKLTGKNYWQWSPYFSQRDPVHGWQGALSADAPDPSFTEYLNKQRSQFSGGSWVNSDPWHRPRQLPLLGMTTPEHAAAGAAEALQMAVGAPGGPVKRLIRSVARRTGRGIRLSRWARRAMVPGKPHPLWYFGKTPLVHEPANLLHRMGKAVEHWGTKVPPRTPIVASIKNGLRNSTSPKVWAQRAGNALRYAPTTILMAQSGAQTAMGGFGSDEGMQRRADAWDRLWDLSSGDGQGNAGGVEGLLDIGWPARGTLPTRSMQVGTQHLSEVVPYPLSHERPHDPKDPNPRIAMDWRSAAMDSALRANPELNSFYRIEIKPGGEKEAQEEAQRLITDEQYGREFGQLPPEFFPRSMEEDLYNAGIQPSRFQWYVERQDGMTDADFRAAQEAQLKNLKVVVVDKGTPQEKRYLTFKSAWEQVDQFDENSRYAEEKDRYSIELPDRKSLSYAPRLHPFEKYRIQAETDRSHIEPPGKSTSSRRVAPRLTPEEIERQNYLYEQHARSKANYRADAEVQKVMEAEAAWAAGLYSREIRPQDYMEQRYPGIQEQPVQEPQPRLPADAPSRSSLLLRGMDDSNVSQSQVDDQMKKGNLRPRITADPRSVDALFGPFNRPSCMLQKSAFEPPPLETPPPSDPVSPEPPAEPPAEPPVADAPLPDSGTPELPPTDVTPPKPSGEAPSPLETPPPSDPVAPEPPVEPPLPSVPPAGTLTRPMLTAPDTPDWFSFGDIDNKEFDAMVTSGNQKPWAALEAHKQKLTQYLTESESTGVHATPDSPAMGQGHTTDAARQDATNELLRIHMIQKARDLRVKLGTDTPVYPQQIAAGADKFMERFNVDGVISNQEVKNLAANNDEISAMLAQAPDASGFGKVKNFLQDRSPLELGLLMVGVPLALIGLFGAIGGEGGFGSFMALLLGGAATAAGLGAFGRFKKTKPSIPSATAAGPAGLHKGRGVESMVMLYDSPEPDHRSGGLKALDAKLRSDAQRPGPGGALEPQLQKLYAALHGSWWQKSVARLSPVAPNGTPNPLHGMDDAGIVAYAAQQMGVTPTVAERFIIMYGHLLRYRRNNPRYQTAPQTASPQP